MTLKDLVPPLELCTLIPDGEFEDSAFMCEEAVGMASRKTLNIRIIPRQRITSNPYFDRHLGREYYIYPAPTLQEIVEKLSRMPKIINPTVWKQGEFWIMDCAYDPSGNLIGMLSEDFWKEEDLKTLDVKTAKDKNPSAAALRLWLELKEVAE